MANTNFILWRVFACGIGLFLIKQQIRTQPHRKEWWCVRICLDGS